MDRSTHDRSAPAPHEDYEVTVDGRPVAVHGARVLDPPFAGQGFDYGGPYFFAVFDVAGPTVVRVASPRPLFRSIVRPAAGAALRLLDDHTLEIDLDGPRKISLEPDGRRGPLFLFADPPERDPPARGEAGVVWFGPGVHDAGRIDLRSGQTLYLAAGAVVRGGIVAEGDRIRIAGRGILDGSDYGWREGPTPCSVLLTGEDIDVSGITIRGSPHWTIVPKDCRRVTIRGVKICGARVRNDDGVNPCNSKDVLVADCFIRTDDDCVAMKGLTDRGPDSGIEGIRVERCVLWSDRARIFLLGHESSAPHMRNIVLRDLDVIHFALPPFLFEPGEEMEIGDVSVEDARIHGEGQKELIRLRPVVNEYMRRQVPGHVSGIRFRNVSVTGRDGLYLVQIAGADRRHRVRDVSFCAVEVTGEMLTRKSGRLRVGRHVDDLRF